jgi:hypothetical protein
MDKATGDLLTKILVLFRIHQKLMPADVDDWGGWKNTIGMVGAQLEEAERSVHNLIALRRSKSLLSAKAPREASPHLSVKKTDEIQGGLWLIGSSFLNCNHGLASSLKMLVRLWHISEKRQVLFWYEAGDKNLTIICRNRTPLRRWFKNTLQFPPI